MKFMPKQRKPSATCTQVTNRAKVTTSNVYPELQREMAAAVMQPLTAEERCARHPGRRDMSIVAASFIVPNSKLSSFERSKIYNRLYGIACSAHWLRIFGLRAVVGAHALKRSPSPISQRLPAVPLRCQPWLQTRGLARGQSAIHRRRHLLAVNVARHWWAFIEAFDNADPTR